MNNVSNHGNVTGRHYRTGKAVEISWNDGIVQGIDSVDAKPEVWIAPALFDLQVNGFGGVDFQQSNLTLEDLARAVGALQSHGCTRFLLTLISDEWETLTNRFRLIRALRSQSIELQTAIAGWHVEGPFLSKEAGFHGAHNPNILIEPTPEHILELQSIAGTDPLLLTLSPEVPGVERAIRIAVENKIRVSLGHTNASDAQIQTAIEAGATGFTHLGNGCPRMLDRHDNILWRILSRNDLTVSFIPDKIHVSPAFFQLAHSLIGCDRIYYTTDAMAAASMPPGRYSLGKLSVEVGADRIVRQPGQSLFAGSALTPTEGVFRAASMLKCPWQDTWQRFSETPAAFMGLRNELAVGHPADFCVLRVAADRPTELQVYKRGLLHRSKTAGSEA